jgi:serine/threonine protein phosphatase 1
MMGPNYEQAAAGLEAAVPGEHFKFFALLKTSVMTGKYFLCHAGVRPGIPRERQSVSKISYGSAMNS